MRSKTVNKIMAQNLALSRAELKIIEKLNPNNDKVQFELGLVEALKIILKLKTSIISIQHHPATYNIEVHRV